MESVHSIGKQFSDVTLISRLAWKFILRHCNALENHTVQLLSDSVYLTYNNHLIVAIKMILVLSHPSSRIIPFWAVNLVWWLILSTNKYTVHQFDRLHPAVYSIKLIEIICEHKFIQKNYFLSFLQYVSNMPGYLQVRNTECAVKVP